MQLTPQESSAAFWTGAKKGALRSLGYVALLGAASAGIVFAFGVPITMFGLGAAVISAISTVLTVGMFSGHIAVSQYHQQKHNALYEAKFAELEGHTQAMETPEEHRAHLQHSPKVTTVLQHGARVGGSYVDAEEQRAATAEESTGRTIH